MNGLNEQILEDFITQHRRELDVFEPSAEMWQHIAGALDEHLPATTASDDSDVYALTNKSEQVLENFISQHQSALQLFEPPLEAWQKIAGELDKVKEGELLNTEDSTLENFVLEHQNELDVFEPSLDLWQKISGELGTASIEKDNKENRLSSAVAQVADNEVLTQFITQNKEELNLFEPSPEV